VPSALAPPPPPPPPPPPHISQIFRYCAHAQRVKVNVSFPWVSMLFLNSWRASITCKVRH
jgi:hypothetical protein